MLAWFATGIISLLALAAGFLAWRQWNRSLDAVRLAAALRLGDHEEISALLREGVDPGSVPRRFGEPALVVAVQSMRAGCDPDDGLRALRLLLARGADVNERGTEWRTPLIHAAIGGSLDSAEMLLSHGADPNLRDAFGRSAACWAEYGGFAELANLLRDAGERTSPRPLD